MCYCAYLYRKQSFHGLFDSASNLFLHSAIAWRVLFLRSYSVLSLNRRTRLFLEQFDPA
jgi:hypothetical protein